MRNSCSPQASWDPSRFRMAWFGENDSSSIKYSKFPKSWLTGRLQGITVDPESLMLPEIILFFLAGSTQKPRTSLPSQCIIWPDAGGVSPISHNALDRIIFMIFLPFCQVIQLLFWSVKGSHNDALFELLLLVTRFRSSSCFFLILCYFK